MRHPALLTLLLTACGDGSAAASALAPEQPACEPDGERDWRLPPGADRCVAFAYQDINHICVERGSNVEAIMRVREGVPLHGASCLETTCESADDPSTACPNMR